MDNETKEQATPPAVEPKKKKRGIIGKVVCIVGALAVVLGIIGAFRADSGGSGGGDWEYTNESFASVFNGVPEDEGVVYKHDEGIKVIQATKKGNLVEREFSDRGIWVETKRRYEDGEWLDKGYYMRRGFWKYKTPLGKKRVARYVEVTDKIQRQIEEKKASIAKQVEALQAGKIPGETKTITIPGGVTMEMVWCPPGTFTMGNLEGESAEKPPHQVTLTKGFWMGNTEVTQAQWKSVMGNNPSSDPGDDLPVLWVSWNDCQEFCKDTGLQLPTEAQWEYACRAGSTGPYAGTGKLDEMGWHGDNSDIKTHPVGTKQPNAWGLYDMHGNVWEWCADLFTFYSADAVTDPQGSSPYDDDRVSRGGCFRNAAGACRSSYRTGREPSEGRHDTGFRVVRTLSE